MNYVTYYYNYITLPARKHIALYIIINKVKSKLKMFVLTTLLINHKNYINEKNYF